MIRIFKLILLTLSVSVYGAKLSYSESFNNSTIKIKNENRSSGFSGDIEFSSNQFADDVGEVQGNQYFGELSLRYEKERNTSTFEKKFEFKARMNNADDLMFALPEAYVRIDSNKADFYLGKQIIPWSIADTNWGFGELNNRVNFDGFTPGQDGLVAARFVKKFKKIFKVEAFASFFYVPELNPALDIDKKKGTVKCNNPWCNAPAETTEITGTDVPIFYNVNYPDVDDIVLKPSGGLRFGIEHDVISVLGFYTRKPENKISTSVEVQFETDNNRVFADITPEVYYHNVYGADVKINLGENWSLNGTSIVIRPDGNPDTRGKVFEYLEIRPKKIAEEYAGGGISFKANTFSSSVNYIARLSNFEKEADDPLIEYPRWNQAVHFNMNSSLTKKLSLMFDVKYDTLTDDRLTMFKASYLLKPNLMTSFGFNMIGASEDEDSYWTQFENNDSLYGSLKYIF